MAAAGAIPSRAMVVHRPQATPIQRAHLDNIVRRSLNIHIKDHGAFHRYGKGDIVVLFGTSTAGKTSINENLIELEPGRKEDDIDLRRPPASETKEHMYDDMFEDTMKRSIAGITTILSFHKVEKFAHYVLFKNFHAPIRKVLVFCPFSVLGPRVSGRNREALRSDPSNYRNPIIPLDMFSEFYTQKNHPAQPTLEIITRQQATALYSEQFDSMISFKRANGERLPPDAQILIDKEESVQEFLRNLGFDRPEIEQVEVTPRDVHLYDMVVHNATYEDSAQIAHILHEGTHKEV